MISYFELFDFINKEKTKHWSYQNNTMLITFMDIARPAAASLDLMKSDDLATNFNVIIQVAYEWDTHLTLGYTCWATQKTLSITSGHQRFLAFSWFWSVLTWARLGKQWMWSIPEGKISDICSLFPKWFCECLCLLTSWYSMQWKISYKWRL